MIARPTVELEGRTLGEFALREKIGEGGFATVHRAFQPGLEREAVVKVLHTRLANRPDIIQRFLREARLASRLDHPYAAHVYAFGAETDGTLWIAMELVRGTPMDKLLEQQGPIALDRFVPLFERICEVVQTAHERGIVHRDLKPANVMVLSRAGRLLPKLLDFGIARVLDDAQSARSNEPATTNGGSDATRPGDEDARPTRAGAVMGSPLYMAPEQWTDAGSVGPPVDIYALGVLAYEALTGRLPFPATSLDEVMVSHARKEPPPLGGDLPKELDAVIARALAKQPADRYATAGDLASAIRGATGRGDSDALPQLDEPLREAMAAGAPQPLAEAIAALEAARNIDQACAILWDVVLVTTRWIGALALAARTKIGPGGDHDARDVQERLRGLGRGDVGDEDWLLLARALTRPFVRKRDAYPIPELIDLLHAGGDLAVTPADSVPGEPAPAFVEAFHRLRTLRGALDRRGGKSDEQRRELYVQALAAIAELLRPLRFVLDYTVIVTRKGRAERWRGLRRSPRPVVVRRARALPDGEAFLLDVDGSPVLKLAPLVQTAPPAPGKDDELFLFDGRGPNGARLVAVPHGFERHDAELDAWFRDHLFDVVDTGEGGTKLADETAPYRGLATFTSADSSFYFGREKEVDAFVNRLRVEPFLAVVNRLRVEPFLAVVGPSGAGKSSFVQAGVVPRLPTGWRAVVVRPGMSPAASLAARLAKHGVDTTGLATDPRLLAERLRAAAAREGSTILLVIDQLEEMVTLCKNASERAAFAEALVAAATSDEDPVRVVVTLRDDFLMRAEAEPALRDRLARGMKLLATPASEDLERIVVDPAKRVGYQFEDRSLVADMVKEVSGQPGALALLSFTAAELWKLRDRHFHQLSRKSYTAIGGVGGALAKHAETTLAEMSADEQRLTREAFRHLVTAEGTRQVLQRSELQQLLSPRSKQRAATDSDAIRGNAVIDHLIGARLLVASEEAGEGQAGEARVEIVHEALIGAWPRLEQWIREDADGARMRGQLRAAARQWHEQERPGGLLWRGDVLADLERWRRHPDRAALTEVEWAFADASRREASRTRRIRRTLVVVAFAALAVAVVILLRLTTEAREQGELALANAIAAQQRLAENYEEQGRLALLGDRAGHGLVYLLAAIDHGAPRSPAIDFLIAEAVARLEAQQAVLRGHDTAIRWGELSRDGAHLLTVSGDGARIWDLRSRTSISKISVSQARLEFGQLDPSGARVLTSSIDGISRLFSTDGRLLHAFGSPRPNWFLYPSFSPDGARIATVHGDAVRIWDASTGTMTAEIRSDQSHARRVQFTPDGGAVVIAGIQPRLEVRDARTGELRAALIGHEAAITWLAWSPDGRRLATASNDRSVRIWDTTTWVQTAKLQGHSDYVESVAFDPSGRLAITASRDRTARIWNVATGAEHHSLAGNASVFRAVFDASGERVVTACADGTARVWDAASGAMLASLEGHTARIAVAAFAPGGDVITAGTDGTVRIWRPRSDALRLLRGHTDGVHEIDYAGDGTLSSTSDARTTRVWSSTGELVETLDSQGGYAKFNPAGPAEMAIAGKRGLEIWRDGRVVHRLETDPAVKIFAYSSAGQRLVVVGSDAARVWEPARGTVVSLAAQPAIVAAELSPDGERVMTASEDGTVRISNGTDGTLVAAFRTEGPLWFATLSPTGDLVLTSASGDTTVKLWDPRTGRHLGTLAGHEGRVWAAKLDREGKRAVTVSADGTARIWTIPDGELIAVLEGHSGSVTAGQFDRTGHLVVTGGADRTVRIWDPSNGRMLGSYLTHPALVSRLAVKPDGSEITSAAVDGTVAVRRLPRTPELARVRAVVTCLPLTLKGGRILPRRSTCE